VTRRGYHCRGRPGSARGKPALVDRQNRPSLRGRFADCDASRAWSGAVLRPLSLLDIYSISGESVLGRRQIGAALRIPAPTSSYKPLN